MNKLRNLFIIVVIVYVLIHLYLDIFDRASHRSAEIDRILDYGDGLISGKYPFNRRYGADIRVITSSENVPKSRDCTKNMELKRIDVYDFSYIAIYRGSESNGIIMCELSVYPETEGKLVGELLGSMAWFETSDADKFTLGKAFGYYNNFTFK
jgi:hypothetical protein